MTADVYLVLVCDHPECDAETHSPTRVDTHRELRRLRRANGWRTRRAAGRLLDLCPNHATATEETETP